MTTDEGQRREHEIREAHEEGVRAAREKMRRDAAERGAWERSRRREFNPNSDKPVCQGGPRWYVGG